MCTAVSRAYPAATMQMTAEIIPAARRRRPMRPRPRFHGRCILESARGRFSCSEIGCAVHNGTLRVRGCKCCAGWAFRHRTEREHGGRRGVGGQRLKVRGHDDHRLPCPKEERDKEVPQIAQLSICNFSSTCVRNIYSTCSSKTKEERGGTRGLADVWLGKGSLADQHGASHWIPRGGLSRRALVRKAPCAATAREIVLHWASLRCPRKALEPTNETSKRDSKLTANGQPCTSSLHPVIALHACLARCARRPSVCAPVSARECTACLRCARVCERIGVRTYVHV